MNNIHILLLAFLGVVLAEDLMLDCPESEKISPCKCEVVNNTADVVCETLESVDQIYESVKQIRGHKIGILYFQELSIPEPIKSDAFIGASVEEIFFFNSTIVLESPQFTGLEDHLGAIFLVQCFDKANPLGTLSLGHLVKLQALFLELNEIDVLPDGWLTSAPDSLHNINLSWNGLTSLGEHVFAQIPSLASMYLSKNKITSLKRSMFPRPAMDLLSLNLRDNQLSHLPSDIFMEMPNLQSVDMQNNHLTTLDRATWSDALSRHVNFHLEGNPLNCNTFMKWLLDNPAWDQGKSVHGTCDAPVNMKGKPLNQLEAGDFD